MSDSWEIHPGLCFGSEEYGSDLTPPRYPLGVYDHVVVRIRDVLVPTLNEVCDHWKISAGILGYVQGVKIAPTHEKYIWFQITN